MDGYEEELAGIDYEMASMWTTLNAFALVVRGHAFSVPTTSWSATTTFKAKSRLWATSSLNERG